MSVPKEIERKWIVDKNKIPFDLSLFKSKKIIQSYISFCPTIRLRSENDEKFILCVKSKPRKNSVVRDEYEMELTREEYNNLILKTEGRLIEKTRYLVPDGKYIMEIDVFGGELEGLCYMEVEFESEDKANVYIAPKWVKREVTHLKGFSNASLAKDGMPKI